MKSIKFVMVEILLIIIGSILLLEPVLATDQLNSYIIGKTGFLVIDQKIVLSLTADYNGLTIDQRLNTVAARLKKLITRESYFRPENLVVDSDREKAWLKFQGLVIVIADPYTARHYRIPPRELAELWKSNLINVLSDSQGSYKVKMTFEGLASWYGKEFSGRRTANGDIFNEMQYTAAHRTLAFGTKLRVTNLRNEQSIIVTVNDRGPWIKGRVIDLSRAAARDIGIDGVTLVKIEVLAAEKK